MTETTAAMQELWPQVLQSVKTRRRFTWILLSQNAKALSYDGAALTLSWSSQGSLDNFTASGSPSVLEESLREVLCRPAVVDSVVEGTPLVLLPPTEQTPSTPVPLSAAATTSSDSASPNGPASPLLHRILGQTAFLMHEQGNNRAAALLADVTDVELAPDAPIGQAQNAVLITPPPLVPRFTGDVVAAIRPVFEHVAGRHGLKIHHITVAPLLPEIDEDWRHTLRAKLTEETPASHPTPTGAKAPAPPAHREEPTENRPSGCTRHAKTTGRQCRRDAAEWPAHDDLPAPVAACASHLTPQEWAACQQARDRARQEYQARWKEELAAREALGNAPTPTAASTRTRRPCTGACTSQEDPWGGDSDSASMSCANCDNWVCQGCGQAPVEAVLEFCADCTERDAMDEPEPEWDQQPPYGTEAEPTPQACLTTMVTELVKTTGKTYKQVNARLNRKIGVSTRIGADEQIIRRAAAAARDWLDELSAST
ncbi:hypothetical protein ACWEIK_27830 [Streptomyces sp. NPDC004673]